MAFGEDIASADAKVNETLLQNLHKGNTRSTFMRSRSRFMRATTRNLQVEPGTSGESPTLVGDEVASLTEIEVEKEDLLVCDSVKDLVPANKATATRASSLSVESDGYKSPFGSSGPFGSNNPIMNNLVGSVPSPFGTPFGSSGPFAYSIVDEESEDRNHEDNP